MNNESVWIDIWKEEPPRHAHIFFLVGAEHPHFGEMWGHEKLRKCYFYDENDPEEEKFECDLGTEFDKRVTHWFPIPYLDDVKLKECVET